MRYIYIRMNPRSQGSTDHNGVLTIGYENDKNNSKLRTALCFCSPKDQFNKKIAYQIINERFEQGIISIFKIKNKSVIDTYNDCINCIITELTYHQIKGFKEFKPSIPNWFKIPNHVLMKLYDRQLGV